MDVSSLRRATVLALILFFVINCKSQSTEYTFIIFNDIKGQLQDYKRGTEVDKPVVPCAGECRGGFRKVMEQIQSFSNSSDMTSTYVITPGNLVGGESGWLPVLGWSHPEDSYGELVRNFYKPNIASLGMHDFKGGLKNTIAYMSSARAQVVLSNVICDGVKVSSTEKQFCDHEFLTSNKVYPLTETIGVVGFVNQDVMRLSSPGELQFAEVIPALRNVIASTAKFMTYIAIGDGNWEMAKDILDQIPEIQLVIYGESFGNSKNMTGNFPEETENGFLATAGNYGSSVGKLQLEINSIGVIVNTSDSKLVVTDLPSRSLPVQSTYSRLDGRVQRNTKIIASSHFDLIGEEDCWRGECTLGNLISDAMVHCVLTNLHENMSLPEQEPLFAIYHSNFQFLDSFEADRNISTLDSYRWLPYKNQLYLVPILGSDILDLFKKSATGIYAHLTETEKDWGQFLQVSNGIRVEFNNTGESIEARMQLLQRENTTTGYSVSTMKDLEPDREYYFVIPAFIYEGRNVYEFSRPFWEFAEPLDLDDTTCLAKYVESVKRVAISSGERISFDKVGIVPTIPSSSNTPLPLSLTTLITSMKPVSTVKINLPVTIVVLIIASQRVSIFTSI